MSTPTTGWRRWELGLLAVEAAVLALVARSYHPTGPARTWELRVVFGLVAAYAVSRAIRGPSPHGRRVWYRLLHAAAAVVVLGYAVDYLGTSFLVLHMRAPEAARVALGAEIGVWVILLVLGWRSMRLRPIARGLALLVLFADAFLYIPLCAWMWQPPSAAECEAIAAEGVVEPLTPYQWAAELSYPYEVLFVPEEDKVVASFKMAGNTVLDLWDVPQSNRLAVIDVADPGAPRLAELALPGLAIPEHLAYRRSAREIVLNRVGYHDNSLDIVPLGGFPELTLRLTRTLDFPPHGVVVPEDESFVGVLSTKLLFAAFHPETGEPLWEEQLAYPRPLVTLTNLSHSPGERRVYLSVFGFHVGEFDYATREMRLTRVGFAGGDLTVVPEKRKVYQTNMMFQRLHVVDTRHMVPGRTIDLGYQPRPVAADFGRDLLFVGGWFTGEVHAYRLSTLEPVGRPLPVGTYLRKLSYDRERQRLYSGSRCGVHAIDVGRWLGEP